MSSVIISANFFHGLSDKFEDDSLSVPGSESDSIDVIVYKPVVSIVVMFGTH